MKLKKLAALILAASLAVSLLAGCSGKTPVSGSASGGSKDNLKLEEYKDVMQISGYLAGGPNSTGTKDNVTLKYLMDHFKLDLSEMTWPAGENSEDKINMMVASEEMPDVITYWTKPELFNKLADAGMLQPLDDLIAKYMPNFREYNSPEILAKFCNPSDGKIYILPSFTVSPNKVSTNVHVNSVPVVRSDMLELTGMQAPKTTDELYNFLKAVKEKAGPDMIPISMFQYDPASFTVELLFGAMFGIKTFFSSSFDSPDAASERMKHFFYEPEYAEMCKYLAKLYREGLLNPETFTASLDQNKEKATQGRFAYTFVAPGWIKDWIDPAFAKMGLNASYFPTEMPHKAGISEASKYWTYSPYGWSMSCISKSVSDPVRLAKFINWAYTRDGNAIMMHGAPSETDNDWTMDASGQWIYNKPVADQMAAGTFTVQNGGWSYWINLPGTEDSNNPPTAAKGAPPVFQFKTDALKATAKHITTDLKMENYLTYGRGPVYNEKWADIKTLYDRWFADIVLRSAADGDVDTKIASMISELENAGLVDVEKENYQNYLSANK